MKKLYRKVMHKVADVALGKSVDNLFKGPFNDLKK